jgi:hypothetical protein
MAADEAGEELVRRASDPLRGDALHHPGERVIGSHDAAIPGPRDPFPGQFSRGSRMR